MSSLARSVGRIVSFGSKPGQKYRNIPTMVDGIKFASKREAKRWVDLKILESKEFIRNLKRQVPFDLRVNNKLVCRYIADFTYEEYKGGIWVPIVDDAKGYRDRVFLLKRKLMAAVWNVEIRET